MTAATAPAAPYEPVVCCTSSTMERVSIANGWRAAKPGSRNVQAPRVRSSRPYPGREVAAESFDVVTVDATARAFLPPGGAWALVSGAPRAVLLR
ncbi:hypothetical protein SHIRM173S_11790 [Streptomyces hirsutus]